MNLIELYYLSYIINIILLYVRQEMDNIVCIKCNSTFLLNERLICND